MKQILIVEDEFIIAMLLEKQVTRMGHEVVGKVTDGTSAIEMVRSMPVDVILMDIKILGDMDGIQTMKEVRAFSAVPVIYITGNSDPNTQIRAQETNPIAYLVKPVEAAVLADMIIKART